MDKLAELEKELLADMEENPVEYKETVSNVFEIDSNLRTINIPITVKNIGVESDDDVKRLEFTMPKKYGEFDLSQFRIRINYMNANGDKSIYLVEDKKVSGDNITFSWLVGRNVTKYKGQVSFIICLKLSDEKGKILKELNTTLCKLEVLEGLEVVPVIDEKTTDIIEQLLRMVETETTGTVQKVTEEGKKQVAEVQTAAQEIIADREQINTNKEGVAKLKEDISVIDTNKISKPTWEQNGKIPRALNGEIEWTALGLPTAEQTNAAVTDWLNKHPEATTTVENGSLTELKIQSDFLKKIKNDYITPEMFGAKGDGTTDDTIAIQKSVDYAVKNKIKLCMSKKYKTTETITLRGVSYIIDAKSSSIIYSGTGCAIKITKSSDCLIDFGRIDALNGDCVEMYSTSTSDYVQYINLSFICFRAKNNCIKLNPVGGWVTEIRISDGMFNSGNYGIYADCYGADRCNGIKILKVGIEGVKTGFYMANGVQCWDIIAPRFSENYNRVFETVGEVTRVNFIGSSLYYFEKDIFSDKTYTFKINAPCTIIGGAVIANEGVVNGIPLIKTEHGYLNISPKKSVEEIYDIGAIKEYIRRVPAYIYCSNVKKIKLSKEMGRIYGMNEFFLNFYNETATPFEVISSDGAIIYKEVITYKWLKFKWFNEIGWKCFEVNICNM